MQTIIAEIVLREELDVDDFAFYLFQELQNDIPGVESVTCREEEEE